MFFVLCRLLVCMCVCACVCTKVVRACVCACVCCIYVHVSAECLLFRYDGLLCYSAILCSHTIPLYCVPILFRYDGLLCYSGIDRSWDGSAAQISISFGLSVISIHRTSQEPIHYVYISTGTYFLLKK